MQHHDVYPNEYSYNSAISACQKCSWAQLSTCCDMNTSFTCPFFQDIHVGFTRYGIFKFEVVSGNGVCPFSPRCVTLFRHRSLCCPTWYPSVRPLQRWRRRTSGPWHCSCLRRWCNRRCKEACFGVRVYEAMFDVDLSESASQHRDTVRLPWKCQSLAGNGPECWDISIGLNHLHTNVF